MTVSEKHGQCSSRPDPRQTKHVYLDRALPGPIVDLVRDGVPGSDLRERGGRTVYSALCRTAASACQRGWDAWEWEALILEPASTPGWQVELRDGIKPRTKQAVRKTLDSAWESANRLGQGSAGALLT